MRVDPLRDYATKMKRVRVSDTLANRVRTEARAERLVSESVPRRTLSSEPTRRRAPRATEPTTQGSKRCLAHRATPWHRLRMLPQVAAAVCLVVIATGVAFASGTISLSNMPFLDDGSGDAPNSFDLAYAAGNPDGEQGAPVTLHDDLGGGGSSGAYYDPDTGLFSSWGDWAGYKYGFNLSCTGSNIKSVSYQIEGEHTYFETIDMDITQEEIDSGNTAAFLYTKEVSFDYGNQESITDERIVSIYLGYPVPDDVKHTYARLEAGDQDPRLFYEYSVSLDKAAAQTLAKARLVLTATFNDGSTETKTYVIQPVEDFDQKCAAFWEERYEWSQKHGQENPSGDTPSAESPEEPQLYTITEVA